MNDINKITLIGTGLIGASLGLAIKKFIPNIEIIGFDLDKKNLTYSKNIRAIDQTALSIEDSVMDSGLVILSVPIREMKDIFLQIKDVVRKNCIISDTGSTKKDVLAWSEEIFSNDVNFVGGHPMAGGETSGPELARSDLFEGRKYCVISSSSSSDFAVNSLVDIIERINAVPFFIDPDEHDSLVAGISHLPHLLSVFLVNTTVSDNAWKDLNRLAATGYESVSRLASGDVIMHKDICLTNQKHICLWLDKLVGEINYLKDILEKDPNNSTELIEYFSNAKKERDKWLSNFNQKHGNNKIIEDSTQVGMIQYLLGSVILKNIKRLFKRSSD
mgnify:CR=1 FL=1